MALVQFFLYYIIRVNKDVQCLRELLNFFLGLEKSYKV